MPKTPTIRLGGSKSEHKEKRLRSLLSGVVVLLPSYKREKADLVVSSSSSVLRESVESKL